MENVKFYLLPNDQNGNLKIPRESMIKLIETLKKISLIEYKFNKKTPHISNKHIEKD